MAVTDLWQTCTPPSQLPMSLALMKARSTQSERHSRLKMAATPGEDPHCVVYIALKSQRIMGLL